MYQILDGTENVSVKVTAKREILEKLTSSDFSAVADMQEMQINSLIPIKVSVKRYSSECKAEASPNNLVVEINDVKQKVFPLTVSVSGTPQNGCIIGNMTVNPEKITIKGSEPLVESIEKAVVKVDVTGRADSGTVQGNLVLYDSQGNIVDQSKLSNNLNTEKWNSGRDPDAEYKRRTDYISAAGESERELYLHRMDSVSRRQYKSAVQKRCWIRYRR